MKQDMDPRVVQLPLGGMKNLVYLVADRSSPAAAVVDPAWDVDRILSEADARGWRVEGALVTHTHHDHVNGLEELVARTGARVHVHESEADRLPVPPAPGGAVRDGSVVQVGGLAIEVLHTPGHSPGAVCYRAGRSLFTGDTLFVGRTGRTVFPGGSARSMYESTLRLRSLPPDWTVYPGHDYGLSPTSTIGREAEHNPFLRCADPEEFERLVRDWERDHG